jgi:hypothetical protein
MSKGTKAFLNFMFFISASAGAAAIIAGDRFTVDYSFWVSTGAVVFFGLIVAIAQKSGADAESSEHYTDSIYFMGFLFTLVSLATLFYRLGAGGLGSGLAAGADSGIRTSELMNLTTKMIEETFSLIGIAVTTSIAGVFLRNIVRSWFLKNHSDGEQDFEAAVLELKKIAEGMGGGFTETMNAIGNYFEERKELAGKIKKKEEDYLRGLETFTDAVGNFSRRLEEVEKSLVAGSGALGDNLRKQAEGIHTADESLRSLSDRFRSMKIESESINLKSAADHVAAFGRETGELNAVLDSLIDIVQRKVDTMRRAG